MCPPTFFDCEYEINVHMVGNINKVNRDLAKQQWTKLYDIIRSLADVSVIRPVAGLPDMVFTANAAFIHEDHAWVSTFKHQERQGEEEHFMKWFSSHGYKVTHIQSEDFIFEGAGDILREGDTYWVGYGQRTTLDSVHAIAALHKAIHFQVVELATPEFYHLDTCFCPLDQGHILWYPDAFTFESQVWINYMYKSLIPVTKADALNFACNAVCIDGTIVCNRISFELRDQLTAYGYKVIMTDLSEFIKAGGSAKCLTLELS